MIQWSLQNQEPANPEPPEPESPSDDIVTEESHGPATPTPAEDSSMCGNPSMDENLILTSVVGVPDELRVIFSLNNNDVAVVQGNQILACEAFPAAQKNVSKNAYRRPRPPDGCKIWL